jgi:hypothetical protein
MTAPECWRFMTNKAVWTAIKRTAMSDASMVTVRKKPLTWQKAQLELKDLLVMK